MKVKSIKKTRSIRELIAYGFQDDSKDQLLNAWHELKNLFKAETKPCEVEYKQLQLEVIEELLNQKILAA